MTDVRLVPGDAIAPDDLHAAFTAAFADYLIGPFRLAPAQWPGFLARQGADLSLSRAAVGAAGEVQAFALAAPRRDAASWRLATMGALPQARGSGAARILLDDFIARAGAAGCARVELECFAQNGRALRLYRGRGFEEAAPLHGWTRAPGREAGAAAPEAVRPIALEDAYAWMDAVSRRRGDLPLQVTPASLRCQPVALQAWRCGEAQLVAGESAPSQLTVYSLVDEDPAQGGAEQLVRQLLQAFPGHAVAVPQLQRDDLGGRALQRLGFARLPLHQLLMHRTLQ